MDTYWQRVTYPVVLFLQFVPFSLTVALLCDPFKKCVTFQENLFTARWFSAGEAIFKDLICNIPVVRLENRKVEAHNVYMERSASSYPCTV